MKYVVLILMPLFAAQLLLGQELQSPVTTHAVANLVNGQAEQLAPATEQQSFETQLVARSFPASAQGQATQQSTSVYLDAKLGWTYETLWEKGNHLLRLRYPLWKDGTQLLLPEVGEYSVCLCEGCEWLEFAPNKPGCLCEEGATASYLMQSQLH